MHDSFPRVAARHDVDSAVSEVYLKLSKALEAVTPETPADFFRFAAHKIRQTLLEMAERDRRGGPVIALGGAGDSTGDFVADPATGTWDPARLSEFTEFHRKVEELTDEVKDVFSLSYYLGLSQAEIADATGTHPRQVSRLMARALVTLGKNYPV